MCHNCKTQTGPEGFALRDNGLPVDLVSDIEDFHVKFGVPAHDKPKGLTGEMARFRLARLREELDEYEKALNEEDAEGQCDALVDLTYIAIGTAYISGFRFSEAHGRVHDANMKKVRAKRTEDSRHGTTYDIIKPEGWTPCNLRDLCETEWEVFFSDGSKKTVLATGKQDAIKKGEALLSPITERGVQVEEVFQL
jgi:predicted HAD superfamily Cof-like phosphohydrolase